MPYGRGMILVNTGSGNGLLLLAHGKFHEVGYKTDVNLIHHGLMMLYGIR